MPTQSRTRQLGSVRGPKWSKNNTSEYEPDSSSDSSSDSPASSSDGEIIPEDLNLYDPCIGTALNYEQIGTLDSSVDEFRAADHGTRELIVRDFLLSFKSTWQGDNFEKVVVETLIRQHLYGQIAKDPALTTQSWATEEDGETALTDWQISLLEDFVKQFRAAKPDCHEKIIKNAVVCIKSAWAEDVEFDGETVESLTRIYLYGRLKRGSKKAAFETRKWTYQDVVIAMKRSDIHKLALELSEDKPGSTRYLCCYKRAYRQVAEELTDGERQKFLAMSKEWSEKPLPRVVQQRMMKKHGSQAMKDFTSLAYRQFGMRVVILAAYVDSQGDNSMSFFDYNDKNGGTSFKARHPDWEQYPMMGDFSDWSIELFGSRSTSGSKDGPAKTQNTRDNTKLAHNSQGYPILPSIEDINAKGLLYKKILIGRFMSDVYAISIGNGSERVPWSALQKYQAKYIKPKYMPERVTLRQYYHICQRDAEALLEHWTRRQAAGRTPLRFRKVSETILQTGRTSEESDSDEGMQPGTGSEDDSQDDNPGEPSPHSHENGRGASQPNAAADAQVQQQTGGDVAQGSRHARHPLPRPRPRPRPYNLKQPLSDGLREGQTNRESTGDGQGEPGSGGQAPSPNDEMQSGANEGQPLQPRSPNAANEDQPLSPGPSGAADECPLPSPGPSGAADEVPPPSPGPPSAADECPPPSPGPPSAADECPLPSPGPSSAADEGLQLPPAPPSRIRGQQQSASPLQSAEQGGGRRRPRKNTGAAAESPASKRRKVNGQVDGAGSNERRSNRERRPTTKATER